MIREVNAEVLMHSPFIFQGAINNEAVVSREDSASVITMPAGIVGHGPTTNTIDEPRFVILSQQLGGCRDTRFLHIEITHVDVRTVLHP